MRERWQPDGWEARIRIGVLVPHAELGPEAELNAMAPHGVAIHATRAASAESPHVDEAAELLAAAPLHAIGFGFTSPAYVSGAAAEAELLARLEERTNGIPVVAPCAATVAGLRSLKAEAIALFDPPWFEAELSVAGRRYYESAGFEVAHSGPCDLPSERTRITPQGLHGWISEHLPDAADAIVIGGNGFRAIGAIKALEQDSGRPVLTANQALFWAALRAAGAETDAVAGYGRLFVTV